MARDHRGSFSRIDQHVITPDNAIKPLLQLLIRGSRACLRLDFYPCWADFIKLMDTLGRLAAVVDVYLFPAPETNLNVFPENIHNQSCPALERGKFACFITRLKEVDFTVHGNYYPRKWDLDSSIKK